MNLRVSWDIYGFLMLLFADFLLAASTYYQVKVINRACRDEEWVGLGERLFARYTYDQRSEEVRSDRSIVGLERFLRLNYHFLGLLKKLLLFLVLVAFYGYFVLQIILIISVLAVQFIVGVVLRPFRTKILNFTRSLSDLVVVLYFVVLFLADKKVRDLSSLSPQALESYSQEELKERA